MQEILRHSRLPHRTTDGALTFSELAILIQNARVFLGVDTVAMHLAAAMQTPLVAVFGPSLEWSWRPWHCQHELVLKQCPCKLASRFTCEKSRVYECLRQITVPEVVAAAGRMLAGPRMSEGYAESAKKN